jgi:hypothetical protein
MRPAIGAWIGPAGVVGDQLPARDRLKILEVGQHHEGLVLGADDVAVGGSPETAGRPRERPARRWRCPTSAGTCAASSAPAATSMIHIADSWQSIVAGSSCWPPSTATPMCPEVAEVAEERAVEHLLEAEHHRQRQRERDAAVAQHVGHAREGRGGARGGMQVEEHDRRARPREQRREQLEQLELLAVLGRLLGAGVDDPRDVLADPPAVEVAVEIAAPRRQRAQVAGHGPQLAAQRDALALQLRQHPQQRLAAGRLVAVHAPGDDHRRARAPAAEAPEHAGVAGVVGDLGATRHADSSRAASTRPRSGPPR